MRYILILMGMILLWGCSTVVPAVTEYKVVTKLPVSKEVSSISTKSLKVLQAFSSSALMSHHMNYTQGLTKRYAYSQAQWAEPPSFAITNEFLKHIQKANIFKSVLNSKSRSKSDLVLEINVDDFMQYFNEDESKSYVNIALTLNLIDVENEKVLATNSFELKTDTKTLDADGGVKALNSTLEKILNQSIKWLEEVCR